MDSLLQADIFFFVTTAAIGVITLAVLVALFFFIQILRDVRYVSRRLREESEGLFDDISQLRVFLREKGEKIGAMHEIAKGIKSLISKRKRKAKTDKKT